MSSCMTSIAERAIRGWSPGLRLYDCSSGSWGLSHALTRPSRMVMVDRGRSGGVRAISSEVGNPSQLRVPPERLVEFAVSPADAVSAVRRGVVDGCSAAGGLRHGVGRAWALIRERSAPGAAMTAARQCGGLIGLIKETSMMMKIAGAAMMAAVAGLFAVSPASGAIASRTHTRIIASCVVQGDQPNCVVTGHVRDPLAIDLHITANPRQHFSGSESVTCSSAGQGEGSVGLLTGRTPFSGQLFGRWRGGSCSATVTAKVRRSGTFRVWITARV